MKDTLFVMALKQEAMGMLESLGADVLYTGIGKVNAAYALTRELALRRYEGRLPAQIINLGTAGSRCFRTGELIACHQFVQRIADIDAHALHHRFEALLEHGRVTDRIAGAAQADDNAVANQLVGAHAFDIDNVLDA